MNWEIYEARLVKEWGRLTWKADVRNLGVLSTAIPMDGKAHQIELKHICHDDGVQPWYSLLVDGQVAAESGTTISTKAWQSAPLAMLLDEILGVEDFDDLLD